MPSTRQYSFFGNDGYGFPLGMGGTISQEESTANREARERRERREAAQAEQRAEEARQHAEQRDRWNREQRQREQEARDRYRARRTVRTPGQDPYDVLGILRSASSAEIRTAWLRLVKLHHPDVGGNPARFRAVQTAYELLK